MTLEAFLNDVVEILENSGVPYMLTGSLAAAVYALPRATRDIDMVIDVPLSLLDRVVDRFEEKGLYVSRDAARDAWRAGGQFNVIAPDGSWKVDLIVRKKRPFSVEEFSRRRPATLFGLDVSLASLEDLILAKLEWSTMGDSALQRRDVVQLVEGNWNTLDKAYIQKWLDELGLREAWNAVLEKANVK